MNYAKPAKLYLSFKQFVEKYGLKNEATSNIKMKEVLVKLTIPAWIYKRDDKFTTTSGIVNLHPPKETNWVMFTSKAPSVQSASGIIGF